MASQVERKDKNAHGLGAFAVARRVRAPETQQVLGNSSANRRPDSSGRLLLRRPAFKFKNSNKFSMALCLIMLYPKNKALVFCALVYSFYVGFAVSVTIHWFSEFAAGALTMAGIVSNTHIRIS
jgi:hypothetical protein